MRNIRRLAVGATLVLAGCSDEIPTAPSLPQSYEAAAVCTVDISQNSVLCEPAPSSSSGVPGQGSGSVLIGGSYIEVLSANPEFESETRTWSAALQIRNITGQPFGTFDGYTATDDGSKLFVHRSASGGAQLLNPDGYAAFTGASQPYLRYPGILRPGEISEPKVWRFSVPPGTQRFRFTVFLATRVPQPAADLHVAWGRAGALAVGNNTACLRSSVGTLYCWGNNAYGQLGSGTVGPHTGIPVRVASSAQFVQHAIGASGCALDSTGQAHCWGRNSEGNLGAGAISPDTGTPTPVAGGIRFAQISQTGIHTCGLTDDGSAYCWGMNHLGQLGTGLAATSLAQPTAVAGGHSFRQIRAGYYSTCALKANGEAYCWGDNSSGQLGDGTQVNRGVPTRVDTDLRFISIGAGVSQTCALDAGGRAYCWGNQFGGLLGNGATSGVRTRPVPVSTSLRFAALAVGADAACGLTETGEAHCWGTNAFAQVGNQSFANASTPQAVQTDLRFTEIAAGASFACGLATDGEPYCWGQNIYGNTGTGVIGGPGTSQLQVLRVLIPEEAYNPEAPSGPGDPSDSTAVVSAFNPSVRYSSHVPVSIRRAVDAGVTRLRRIIRNDLPDQPVTMKANACAAGSPAINEVVDDIVIAVDVVPFELGTTVAAVTYPCLLRSESGLPVFAVIHVNSNVIHQMELEGWAEEMMLHELLHTVGFLAATWQQQSLAGTGSDGRPYFSGAQARAAFSAAGGDAYDGTPIPLEMLNHSNPIGSHWHEGAMGGEVMTPQVSKFSVFSAVTAGLLEDIGYEVNAGSADAYAVSVRSVSANRVPLPLHKLEIIHDPIGIVEPDGRVREFVGH